MKRLCKFLDSLGAAVPPGWRVQIYRRLERGKMTNRSKFIAPDGGRSYGSVNAVARALGLVVPGEWGPQKDGSSQSPRGCVLYMFASCCGLVVPGEWGSQQDESPQSPGVVFVHVCIVLRPGKAR
jgi:hypothetical protein